MKTGFLILQVSDNICDVTAELVCAVAKDFNERFFDGDFQVLCTQTLNLHAYILYYYIFHSMFTGIWNECMHTYVLCIVSMYIDACMCLLVCTCVSM